MPRLVWALALLARFCAVSAVLLQSSAPNRSTALQQPQSQAPQLQNGTAALLCGLKGEFVGLNGRKVRVVRFNGDSRRYTVGTFMPPGARQTSGRASVDAKNLVHLTTTGTSDGPSVGASAASAAAAVAAAGAVAASAAAGVLAASPSCPGVLAASAVDGAHSMAARRHGDPHAVVDHDIFFSKCAQACDDCIADYTWCEAVCHEGCHQYCERVNTLPGCSSDGYWSASPGQPGQRRCTWDDGPNSCRKYRNCNSDNVDSCPEWYLY